MRRPVLEPGSANMLAFRLARVDAKLNAQAARIVGQASDLTLVQFRIMLTIETIGQSTPTEIARHSEFDKGQLSRTISKMIDDGLLDAMADETDQRSHSLSLTLRGRALFARAQPAMRARQAHLLGSLTAQEREAVFSALDKLEVAADWMPPEQKSDGAK